MEKLKVNAAMTEISTNLKKEYFVQGKKFKHVTTELPYKLLKKLARNKVNDQESYQFGTIGKSNVATPGTSRKERRESGNFEAFYNGDRYKLVRSEKYDEKKKKSIAVETYELIEG
jgi:hypothetical protein